MRFKLFFVAVALSASATFADAPATQSIGDRHAFTVHAVAPQLPALRFSLNIEAGERQPGDAQIPSIFGMMDRRIAALRGVEALRAFAADHEGKLPARLEDVTDTPVPVNPITGKAFEYRNDGNTAILADEHSSVSTARHANPLVYTLQITKP